MAEQRERLQELENLIANIGAGSETVTDEAFEDRLREAEREVMNLLQDAQKSKGRWTAWHGPLTGCSYCHKSILCKFNIASHVSVEKRIFAKKTEGSISQRWVNKRSYYLFAIVCEIQNVTGPFYRCKSKIYLKSRCSFSCVPRTENTLQFSLEPKDGNFIAKHFVCLEVRMFINLTL